MNQLLPECVLMVAGLFPTVALGETTYYGAFVRSTELPEVLFLTGEVKTGDSFELRRAMRDQDVKVVVAASPGGNLYEGLQIAAILNDHGIGTFVPLGTTCESTCAIIFLGGASRRADGDIGVHQFYLAEGDTSYVEPKNSTISSTQYTTSEIMKIMSDFTTPQFFYEKMFGNAEIYYFSYDERSQLDIEINGTDFSQKVDSVHNFLRWNKTVIVLRYDTPAQADLSERIKALPPLFPIAP